MSIIEISNDNCFLKTEKGFIVISRQGEEPVNIPFGLIDSIITTSSGACYTNSLLRRLCEEGIPLIICGANYQPAGILNGINLYHKTPQRLQQQIELKPTVSKQMWAFIVKQKARHQADVLKSAEKDYSDISIMSQRIKSGDPDNMEAQIARKYWERLFGYGFTRDPEKKGVNSFLNYGYAVIRGAVTRYIVCAGLNPALGIHHRNKLNPFCLADDLIEPFRPIVDMVVFNIFTNGAGEEKELTPACKKELVEILSLQVIINKNITNIANAIQKFVWSFAEPIEGNRNSLMPFDIN